MSLQERSFVHSSTLSNSPNFKVLQKYFSVEKSFRASRHDVLIAYLAPSRSGLAKFQVFTSHLDVILWLRIEGFTFPNLKLHRYGFFLQTQGRGLPKPLPLHIY